MSVLLTDDFSSTLTVGSGNWWFRSPSSGADMPVTSGGALQLPYADYLHNSQLASFNVWPLHCTTWTWEIADLDTAGIYSTFDFFGASFTAEGSNASFRWTLRWRPASLGPPETAGTDTVVMLYPSWNTFYPPASGSGSGTPVAFDISDHKWLRIREECKEIKWQVSGDGSTWTDVYSTTLNLAFEYESDYGMSIGMHAGYTFTTGYTYFSVGSVSIENIDDCLCAPVPELTNCDHFERADGGLGSNWDDVPIIWSDPPNPLVIIDGAAEDGRSSGGNEYAAARYTTAQPDIQIIEAEITRIWQPTPADAGTAHYAMLLTNMTTTDYSMRMLEVFTDVNASYGSGYTVSLNIVHFDADGNAGSGSFADYAYVATSTETMRVRFESEAVDCRAYVDGVLVLTWTDPDGELPGRFCGIATSSRDQAGTWVDSVRFNEVCFPAVLGGWHVGRSALTLSGAW